MLAAHNLHPVAFGLDKPHVKRILLASLVSIVVHAIAGQWIWHPATHKISLSLPRPLEVVFAIPQPTPPSAPAKAAQAVQKYVNSTVATSPRPAAPTHALPLTNAQAPAVANTVEAPAPAAPEITAPTPEPSSTAPIFNAAYLQNPQPSYPLSARRRGIEGKVLLRAEVRPDGVSNHVEVKKSSGWEMLDQAALQAVQNWRFVPARQGTQAVTAWVEIPIAFQLENDHPKQFAAKE